MDTTRTDFRLKRETGIEPVDGWALYSEQVDYGRDRCLVTEYWAAKGEFEVPLDHSAHHFTPTAERFAWLVRAGLPRRNWFNHEIDAAIAAERAVA